jgi:alkylation response protein AidB-like acyl-CoA dehydrogenase
MLEFTPEQNEFRAQVARFVKAEIAPKAQAWSREDRFPREIPLKLGALGWLSVGFDPSFGGVGGAIERCILIEELAKGVPGVALGVYVHSALAAASLAEVGSRALAERFVPAMLTGRCLGAWAYAEPGSGADVTQVRLSARRKGGDFVLNGDKAYITNGTCADLIMVVARTGGEAGKLSGLSVLAVDGDTPGLTRRPMAKLGMQPSELGQLHFDECVVPAERILGEVDQGFRDCLSVLSKGRVFGGALALGIAGAAFETALAHVGQRRQFGAPLAAKQAVRFTIADMLARLAAARALVYGAARAMDAGHPFTADASLAKLVASEAATWIAERGLHVQGAQGFMLDSPAQRYYRDCKVVEWGEGVNELQREMIFEAAVAGYRP